MPPKVPTDAPNDALEHATHLAGLEVAELVPHERGAVLVVGAIEKDDMEVRVQSEGGVFGPQATQATTLPTWTNNVWDDNGTQIPL